jgi:hypothetical protein
MAPISSAGSFAIPAAQPARRQAESSETATETELTVKKQEQVQRASDEQSRGSSEQVKEADDNKSAEQQREQQKIEAARQEAQRAEFDQQAGNVRETEPNDVRPPSSKPETAVLIQDNLASENPAIETFNQFQNIDAAPRQGQELNQFV